MSTSAATGAGGDDPRGKATEEFRLLLDAVAEKAQPWLQRLSTEGGAEHTPGTCDWCPVCAVAAVFRGEHSELATKAAEHAAGLLAVVRAAVRQPAPPPSADQAPAEAGQPPRVQKIAVQRRVSGDASGSEDVSGAEPPC